MAQAWCHHQIVMLRQQLPPLTQKDEYYWCDLIGLTVINRSHIELGTVIGLIESPNHDTLQIKNARTRQTLLIPYHRHYIDAVDISANTIKVDWQPDW